MSKKFKGGVVTGDEVQAIFNDALENQYALPAVNVVGTNSVNAVLETAANLNSPVMIQFSNGGGVFYLVKAYLMKVSKLQLPDLSQVQCMSMLWQKLMMCRSFCILIMLQESYYLG